MDQTTAWVAAGSLAVIALSAFLVGPRLKGLSLHIGRLFSADLKASGQASARVTRNIVEGDDNELGAKGSGATVAQNQIKGQGNVFKAEG